jgi:Ca2+-binding EF-hand superfamily protein
MKWLVIYSNLFSILSAKPDKTPDNNFAKCDRDKSNTIDRQEFRSCAKFPEVASIDESVEGIFNLFDVDSDSYLSKSELNLFTKMVSEHDRDIEILTQDGTRRTMKQSEFLKLEEERKRGLSVEDGKVTKVDEGSATLDQLKSENPELSRFVTLGRWAHHEIVRLGYATGNLTNMKSIDDLVDMSPKEGSSSPKLKVSVYFS